MVEAMSLRPNTLRWSTNWLKLAFAVSLALAFIFPIAWSLLNAFKTSVEASAVPPTYWPQVWSMENFSNIWNFGRGLPLYLGNSLTLAVLTAIGTMVLSFFAGYGFARYRFPFKNTLFVFCLLPMMIPYQSILTPLFVIGAKVNMLNSLVALSLVYILFQLPFSIFLMRNSFEAIPKEMEEAARMDGCGSLSTLWHVMLRLVRPGLITVALYAFINAWNEFFAALLFLSSEDRFSLPIVLATVRSGRFGQVDWGALQAGAILSIIPCVLLFLLLQRHYLEGLTGGAVKSEASL